MGIIMEYQELFNKYNSLLEQVDQLKRENRRLKAKLELQEAQALRNTTQAIQMEFVPDGESNDIKPLINIDSTSDSTSKIRLFMSLFKGRKDVYARRWENKNYTRGGFK